MEHDGHFSAYATAGWPRGRALPVLAALLAAATLASCSAGTPGGPASRAGGESFEQHCADGRPSLVDVAAHRRGRAVVVTWGLPRVVAEPRTYRVLRRGPREGWDRVGQRRLPTDAVRRYIDAAPPTGSLRYAVVEIDACGVGPVCSPTGIGHRCAVATVPARGTRSARTKCSGSEPFPRPADCQQQVALAYTLNVSVSHELLRAVAEGKQNGRHGHSLRPDLPAPHGARVVSVFRD